MPSTADTLEQMLDKHKTEGINSPYTRALMESEEFRTLEASIKPFKTSAPPHPDDKPKQPKVVDAHVIQKFHWLTLIELKTPP